jgi:hypothetical protein
MSKKNRVVRRGQVTSKVKKFVPEIIRENPDDENSPIVEATALDDDGFEVRFYMRPLREGE